MIKNYFKIAWRNLLKNKTYSLINIIGLAIGLSTSLIILLYVFDELSYDAYHTNADEIVRVVFNAKVNGEDIKEAVVMAPVAETLKKDIPEVVDATRFRNIGQSKIIYNGTAFRNSRCAFADPSIFKVFSLPILKGNTIDPLGQANGMVITQNEAKKYFGDEDPIGKVLNFKEEGLQFTVTAVMKEMPKNSHFHFDILVSMLSDPRSKNTSWMESNFYTYVLLKKGVNPKILESKLPNIVEKYMGPQIMQAMGISFAEFTKKNQLGLNFQPLKEIHLQSEFTTSSTLEQGGNTKTVYIFSAIALFMLLIASINFMNLSTATAAKRGKEVGVKKVLGSGKNQLIWQFLTESFIAVMIAMSLALMLLAAAIPFFNSLSNKSFEYKMLLQPSVIIYCVILLIVVVILAGGYPAFYLSSFNPISALKSKFSDNSGGQRLRSGLVVFQFVITTVLIFSALTVDKQLSFIEDKNIGYDKNQILVLREAYLLGDRIETFKNSILADPRVDVVSHSGFLPSGPSNQSMSGVYIGENAENVRRMQVYNVDEHYIPTLGMEIMKGRNFSKDFGSDSSNVIINETAAAILGFADNPLGQIINRATDNQGSRQFLSVIGVVKDFHYQSFHQKIEPLIMLNHPDGGLIVRSKVGDMSSLVVEISKLWSSYNTQEPFSYAVLDDAYKATYLTDKKSSDILKVFAFLTIFVACLGLLGLVTFTAEQKFKEIGIRKVLGSSVVQIVVMLTKDFSKLILFSMLLAFPVGYFLMQNWLQDFEYRTEINVFTFLLAFVITCMIAFLTISIKSFGAANANPIKSLRTE